MLIEVDKKKLEYFVATTCPISKRMARAAMNVQRTSSSDASWTSGAKWIFVRRTAPT